MAQAELEEIQRRLAEVKAVRDALEAKEAQSKTELEALQNQLAGEDVNTKKRDQLKAALKSRFDDHAGEDNLMDYDEFSKALGMKAGKPDDMVLSRRIFDSMPRENNTHITRETFVDTIAQLNTGSFMDRSTVAFGMFDTDNNQRVSEEEFLAFLKCSLLENRLKTRDFDDEQDTALKEVVREIFSRPDIDPKGITLVQFRKLLEQSDLGEGLQLTGLDVRRSRVHSKFQIPEPGKIKRFLVNNAKRIFLAILVLGLSTWAFIYKWCEYNNGTKFDLMGYTLPLAKGCADVMKVSCVFLMIFMCRGLITIWRGSWIGKYVIEFDDAIVNHKLCAELFFLAMWIHVIAHIINVENIVDTNNYAEWKAAYPDKGDTQETRWDIYTSLIGVTGILLTIGFSVVFFFALEWPRNASCFKKTSIGKWANNFNTFWTTHHLVFLCFAILILHPLPGVCWDPCDADDSFHGDTWQWLLLPVGIYVIERIRRGWKERFESTRPEILLATVKRGSDKPVLQLRMTKPDTWRVGPGKVEAGMYCFIKCPELSVYEWHPFTLTSAPHENFMEVHVRGLGDWTGMLCDKFDQVEKQMIALEADKASESRKPENEWFTGNAATSDKLIPRFPTMALEGPYGAPAQGYDRFKVLLLVGAGIGVTPFISILKDIWHQFDRRRCACCHQVNQKNFPLKKAYFNFISRDQASMSWFKDVIEPIVVDDQEKIIECHQHLTSVKADHDIRSAAIKMAQHTSIGMEHDRSSLAQSLSQSGTCQNDMEGGFAGKDILTGAEANIPVHFGRPNWDKIFQYVKKQHPLEEVGVFFCGPPVIGAQLESCSQKYSETNDTQFFYYEEHF